MSVWTRVNCVICTCSLSLKTIKWKEESKGWVRCNLRKINVTGIPYSVLGKNTLDFRDLTPNILKLIRLHCKKQLREDLYDKAEAEQVPDVCKTDKEKKKEKQQNK